MRAQSADAAADALFDQGRDLMTQGKLDEACTAFEASQKLDPTPSTELHLADCRERTGKLATAWAVFLDAERRARDKPDASSQQFRDIAAQRAAKLEPRLSKLEIDVGSHPDGLVIERDHSRVDAALWNRSIPVDGGTYQIDASAPGYEHWTQTIVIAPEGDPKKVAVPALQPIGARAIASPAPPSSPLHRLGFGVMVGGGATAVAGLVVGAFAISKWHDATAVCGASLECDNDTDLARAHSLAQSAYSRGTISTAVFGAGAGIAVAGFALWWLTRHHHAPHDLAIVPRIDPTTAGLELHAGF